MKGMQILNALLGRNRRGGDADQLGELAKAIAGDERAHKNQRKRARLGYLNRADERRAFHRRKGAGAAARLSSRAGSPWHGQPSFVRQVRRQRAAAIEAARADRALVTARKRARGQAPQT